MEFDLNGFAIGLLFGAVVAGLFFLGLGYGIRVALRNARPGFVLLLSAALRISLLLLCAWAALSISHWCVFGFFIAFIMCRYLITHWVRAPLMKEG